MKRTRFTFFLSLGFLLSIRVAAADLNLLLITVDTLRPDRLSCYSPDHLRTPQIDALAEKGVLFERAFAHDPMTLPSHTNILLGMTSLAHGVSENSKSVVSGDFETLAELLKKEGYATGAFVGAFPLDSRFGLDQGFDVYDDFYPAKAAAGAAYSERPAGPTIAAALEWLSGQKGKWFCWVHLWDPHAPYSPPEPYASRYRDDLYSGEVAYVDAEVGNLLAEVEKRGGAGETFIILTGDHGESLGEHGEKAHSYFAYNSTIWIPLIISGPRIKPSRPTVNVSHVDIFPTVCDVLGIKKPRNLHGETLAPFLRGRTRKAEPIFFEALEAHLNRGWAPLRGIIDGPNKFIDSPIPELYDLENDFNEKRNLAAGTEIAAFQKKLDEKMRRDSSSRPAQASQTVDRETRERLRSLGYVASPISQAKASYGPGDDLKTLLPLENKLELATEFESRGEISKSIALLEEIIQSRKDFVTAYDELARIYSSMGRSGEALRVLETGYRENSDNYVMVSVFGIAMVEQGIMDQGIDVLGRAVGILDRDPEVWNSLGIAYWKTGEEEKARLHFEEALALDPNDAIYNDNMGSFLVSAAMRGGDRREVERAVPYFETALAADPYLASAYNGLGGAMRILGRREAAITNWEKAVELDPDYAMAVYNLAAAYLEKGDKAKALEYGNRYLKIKGKDLTPEERREIQALIEKAKR